jgi:hypothetical protein
MHSCFAVFVSEQESINLEIPSAITSRKLQVEHYPSKVQAETILPAMLIEIFEVY